MFKVYPQTASSLVWNIKQLLKIREIYILFFLTYVFGLYLSGEILFYLKNFQILYMYIYISNQTD